MRRLVRETLETGSVSEVQTSEVESSNESSVDAILRSRARGDRPNYEEEEDRGVATSSETLSEAPSRHSMARSDVTTVWYFLLVLSVGLLLLAAAEIMKERSTTSSDGYTAVVFLREQCDQHTFNVTGLEILIAEFLSSGDNNDENVSLSSNDVDLKVDVLSKSAVCDELSGGLVALLQAMVEARNQALIGSIDPALCEMAAKMAVLRGKPFITWSCPQSALSDVSVYPTFIQLTPTLATVADVLTTVITHFRWRSAAILTADVSWWPQLAHLVELSMRREGLLVKHHMVLHTRSLEELSRRLRPLQVAPCRVIILCLPLRSTLADDLLRAISNLKLAHLPATTILAVHLSQPSVFVTPMTPSSDLSPPRGGGPTVPSFHTDNPASRRPQGHAGPVALNWRSQGEDPLEASLDGTRHSIPDDAEWDNIQKEIASRIKRRQNEIYQQVPLPPEHRTNSPAHVTTTTMTSSSPEAEGGPSFSAHPGQPSTRPGHRGQSRRISPADRTRERPRRALKEPMSLSPDDYSKTQRYSPPAGLEPDTRRALLVLAGSDPRWSAEELFGDTQNSYNHFVEDHEFVWHYVREGLRNLHKLRSSNNRSSARTSRFILLDWCEPGNWTTLQTLGDARTSASSPVKGSWRPLLQVDGGARENATTRGEASSLVVTPLLPYLEDWANMKQKTTAQSVEDANTSCESADDENCKGAATGSTGMFLKSAHILAIAITSALLATIFIVTAAVARKQLLRRECLRVLTRSSSQPSDFVFPQVSDSLRVDEGIEAMLCCWLQQLQEFGGPEVDKPDLLKGSVGSLRSHAQLKSSGSTASLTRNVLVDTRARYNGDFVQLKEIPAQGTFELKSKAMDVLVTMHGLRHENLNVLLGCLTEPTRPALVLEWCSRGSLEDVLVQDEIKLDWSFRLSLLTDLVRGMRYLHSSPIKVHGYLTSRNCVIDARWVLKITDYGLPSFFEAQSIPPPSKTARDLLWTAPELLRNQNLQKRGTQTGDVYSFGIIMQEVVVRGEPFCMLSLSPEDIIEKVKKPPPLIRPSVSKGAAPPEAINIMRQCWAEQADMRPDFNSVHDLFKKLNHGRKVNFVDTMFQMLEKYSNNLEELIRERTEQLDMEKKKTEQLLNRMLPSSVADKLKLGMPVDPEDFREVTIYFSDIVGFTTISAYSTPFEVVDLLNDLYTCFDATINAYNVYKVETIGDAYMVVGGLPVRILDHADQIATMALDLLHQSGRFKIRHLPYTPLRLRIGLHTGPCCAGVVGLTMPRYCLFGDTVNTASRMESTGSAWRIHLSQATKEKLDEVGNYQLEYRGDTDIKGKGKMQTYWLLGKGGFDKQLPTPPPIGLDERLIRFSRPVAAEGSESGGLQSGTNSFNQGRSEDTSSGEVSASYAISTSGGPTPPSFPTVSGKIGSCSSGLDQQVTAPSCSFPFLPPSRFEQKGVKVSASIHNDKLPNVKEETKLSSSESVEQVETSSLVGSRNRPESEGVRSSCNHPERGSAGDHHGTPVSASEVAAALLGVTGGQPSAASQFRSNFRDQQLLHGGRHRRVGQVDEDDLSTPYNHYRCLSPSEQHLNQLPHHGGPFSKPHHASSAGGSNRFLKRQFSLDRGDDPPVNILHMSSVSTTALDSSGVTPARTGSTGRLFKQNSAGAANDLERIEEIPPGGQSSRRGQRAENFYRQRCELPAFSKSSMSVSVESLN